MSVHYTDFFRSYRLPDATLLRKVPSPVIAKAFYIFFSPSFAHAVYWLLVIWIQP